MAGFDFTWDEVHAEERSYNFLPSPQITRLLSYREASAPKTALDIGCGSGQLTRDLYHRGFQTLGVDLSSNAIRHARALTVVSDESLKYQQFNAETDDFAQLPHQPYGLVTCHLVYSFITNKGKFLKEVRELVSPGGIFFLTSMVRDHGDPQTHGPAVSSDDFALAATIFTELACYPIGEFHHFIGTR